jgi:hypothetical protein
VNRPKNAIQRRILVLRTRLSIGNAHKMLSKSAGLEYSVTPTRLIEPNYLNKMNEPQKEIGFS